MSTGIFGALRILLERNRLGELLVMNGVLTPHELRYALVCQQKHKDHLGRVLLQQRLVTRRALYSTLAQQWALRFMAGVITFLITFSAGNMKYARADALSIDIPANIQLVSARADIAPVKSYPQLFGSTERRSTNIAPFTKWSDMFKRFHANMNEPSSQRIVQKWQADLESYKNLPLPEMARRVNDLINKTAYVTDNRNWGQTDYWATPVEFFQRGGDCEDYAIAKYTSLRALGVPENRMRIAIVHDLQKNIPHAVLIVYTDSDALILDNQVAEMLSNTRTKRYKPIFSINRTAWWLHTPKNTTLAALQ